MGGSKSLMMEHEANQHAAAHFLVKLGVLQSCEVHGDLYEGDGDIEGAYKAAAHAHKNGTLGFGDKLSQREVTDLIKEAYDDNSYMDACPTCSHHRHKD